MRITVMSPVFLVAALAAAPAVLAQGHDSTRAAGGMHAMAGMSGMSGMCMVMMQSPEDPDAVLEDGVMLNLSEAQRARLQAAGTRVREAHAAAMRQMQNVDRELSAAAGAERVNDAAVRTAFRSIADAHSAVAVAKLRARAETRTTLTAEQRTHLAQMAREHGAGGMAMRDSMGGMRRDSMSGMGRDSMGGMMRGNPAMMRDNTGGGMGMMQMMMNHCRMMAGAADTTGAHRH